MALGDQTGYRWKSEDAIVDEYRCADAAARLAMYLYYRELRDRFESIEDPGDIERVSSGELS